ncbi:NADPH:quinone reductase-like Zn-dependent oxidoreductase [Solibacillus kalamii]|uniref:Alcohol dehydrogenase n=1 Tax=Solibacillus kalamii TaxID=1748298 RepID=A0ABX3ZHK4_9BACL|nr:NAD(P)-dependent alcohol dehydrogenase [Solibacillus kalamii]MBM7663588.1 NADPH:quinone reductase-like Zn-dependent oxidoreductase [Solibacillus kalamii]OUZ39152.1 alcohol dehydrogenase [Solibacillus kalamii]
MKAIVCNKYGSPDVLELKEVEKPYPTENQVLVKIHSASLNFGNLVLLKGKPFLARFAFGLTKPKYSIPGGDIAGTVKAVGKEVRLFKVGDEVFGDLSGCGWGGFAEYVAVPEIALAFKPTNISFEEAAAAPMAGVTALQGLRDKGKLKLGHKVLIYGASGGVGTFAVQIAKAFGAEVTGVCSTRNVEILRSVGADHIIDYSKEHFIQHQGYFDLVLGVNGSNSLSDYTRVLKKDGNFVHVGGSESQLYQTLFLGPFISMAGSKKLSSLLQRANQKDLNDLKELLETNKVKPIIDKRFDLVEIAEAFKYFQEGHAQGKVVITI